MTIQRPHVDWFALSPSLAMIAAAAALLLVAVLVPQRARKTVAAAGAGAGFVAAFVLAIVLAAMYMLRLISAVLHEEPGPAVTDAALDLRGAELAVVVPLVGLLLALSAWPAAISGHSFLGLP